MKFDDLYESIIAELAKGWDADSVKKFSKSIGHDPQSHGFHKACVARMKDDMKDAEGWCAEIKDWSYGSTYWRGKDKPKKDIKKDVKAKQNVDVKEDGAVYIDDPNIMRIIKKNDEDLKGADKKDIVSWAKRNNSKMTGRSGAV